MASESGDRGLVGRDDVTALLEREFREAVDGNGRAVALVGPPGIGKSTVVSTLARESDFPVLVGRCAPPPSTPMRSLTEVVVGALGAGASLDAVDDTVFAPALDSVLGQAHEPVHPAQHALLVGEGIRLLLADAFPAVVCVIEDLHWADDETIAVLDYLVDHLESAPVLLVTTARPHEAPSVDEVIAEWQRRGVHVEPLRPLTDDETAELITRELGATATDTFIRAVVRTSEGNPLLATEFLRDATVGSHSTSSILPIPTTYRTTIASRVAALPSPEREAVQLAALVGRTLDPTVLGRIGIADPNTAIDHAVRGQLAEPEEPGSATVRFRHGLTRDAVAATLTNDDRRRLAGDALTHVDDGHHDLVSLDVASYLAVAAGDEHRAASLLIEGAQQAISIGATATALDRLDEAAAIVSAESLHGPTIRECRVEALAQAGRAAEAREIGTALVGEMTARGDDDGLHRVQIALARSSGSRGDWPDAAARLDGTFGDHHDAPTDALSYRAIVAIEQLEVTRARALAERALARPDLSGAARCEVHEVLGRVAREHSYHDAADHFRAGLEAATEAGLDLWRTRSLLELGLSEATNFGRTELFTEASRSARRSGALALSAMCDYNLSNLHAMRFEMAQATPVAERAIDTAGLLGSSMLQALGWLTCGQSVSTEASTARAKLAGDRARLAAPDSVEVDAMASGMCFGFADLVHGDLEAAAEHYARSLELLLELPFRTGTAPWYFGPVVLATTDHDLAPVVAAELHEPWAQAIATLQSESHLVDAILAGRTDGPDAAASHLELLHDSLDHHRALSDAVAGVWQVLFATAAVAGLRDGWGDPTGDLQRAESWFREHGHEPPRRWCAGLLRDAGVAPRTRGKAHAEIPDPLVAYGITNREYDVLCLLGDRLTNREISERLVVSPSTVKSHVERLLSKTNRSNRVELAELFAAVVDE